ncbi:CarD family transcriptional regulator, partial [Parolsenella catena]
MFSVGERVVHPGQGLCTVVGFQDSPAPMLILETGSGRGATRLMYPAAQAEKNLHPPVGREEAL